MAKKKNAKTISNKISKYRGMLRSPGYTPEQRKAFYLEVKRLSNLKSEGNILMAESNDLSDIYNSKAYFHPVIIIEIDKRSNMKINTVSHTKFKKAYSSKDLNSYINLDSYDKFRNDQKINLTNTYESSLNGKLSEKEFKEIKEKSKLKRKRK